jgi:hypothetical protein
VSVRKWFERAYVYWLWRKWRIFIEKHRLLGLLLIPFIAMTFILVTGLLLLIDILIERLVRK